MTNSFLYVVNLFGNGKGVKCLRPIVDSQNNINLLEIKEVSADF